MNKTIHLLTSSALLALLSFNLTAATIVPIPFSSEPVASAVSTNDDVILNATNNGTATWTTKRATVSKFVTGALPLILPSVTNAANAAAAGVTNGVPAQITNAVNAATNLLIGTITNSALAARSYYQPNTAAFDMVSRCPVPWLSWCTWWSIGNNDSNSLAITDSWIRTHIQDFATNGMRDAGYNLIMVDDGWQYTNNTLAAGALLCNSNRFPYGMKDLADYAHGMGFKIGLYLTRWTNTCLSMPNGAIGREAAWARTISDWGYDQVSLDACGAAPSGELSYFYTWNNAFSYPNVARPIIVRYASDNYTTSLTPLVNAIYTGQGVAIDSWANLQLHWPLSLNANFNRGDQLNNGGDTPLNMVAPGHYFDISAIVPAASTNTLKDALGAFAILCQPINAYCNSNMAPERVAIYADPLFLRVLRDPLVIPGHLATNYGGVSVWVRPVSDTNNYAAVYLSNTNASTTTNVLITPSLIGWANEFNAYDIWAHTNFVGTNTTITAALNRGFTNLSVSVPASSSRFLYLSRNGLTPTETVTTAVGISTNVVIGSLTFNFTNGLLGAVVTNYTATDTDVTNFAARAGITDNTQLRALDTAVIALKAANIWTNLHAVYPFIGGNSMAHSLNLASTNYGITWNGTVTHNANGVTGDGATGYGDTRYYAGVSMKTNSGHYYVYQRLSGLTETRNIYIGDGYDSYTESGIGPLDATTTHVYYMGPHSGWLFPGRAF